MQADRFYRLLKLNRRLGSHRLKFAGLLGLYWLRRRHLWLRFDPVMSCNLRCQMCYFSDPEFTRNHTGHFSPPEIERIAEAFFPWTAQLYVGCGTEPTTYKHFIDIVALGKKHRVPMVGLVSNGQLLTAEHLECLVARGLDELTLSIHGVTRQTYERMMRRASFDKFLAVLDQLEEIKKDHRANLPQLRLNYTVNPDNLDELAGFFEVFGKYSIRTLQIRPIVDLGNTEYTKKDLAPHAAKYNRILTGIEAKCREKGIRLLANYEDVSYEKPSTRAALASEAVVYLSPQSVSKPGFDWRKENYLEYCRRTGWSSTLLRKIVAPASHLASASPILSYKVLDS